MKKIIALTFMCLLLNGCFGTSQPADFYMLKTEQNLTAVSNAKYNIGVEAVEIPDYVDKPQIVWQKKESTELMVSEMNRWGESLSSMIQRVLVNDLSELLPRSFVKPKTFSREDFTRIVFVEIDRFDAVMGENAYLQAWFTISDENGTLINKGKVDLTAPVSDSYQDYTQTQSSLIAKMAQKIAQKMK